jgi:hypothetical protein
MYFGEIIVLAITIICLYGLYGACIELIRRNQESIRFVIQEEDEHPNR